MNFSGLPPCIGKKAIFYQLKFITRLCAACLQSPGRKFNDGRAFPSAPRKAPGAEVVKTAHCPPLFVGENHINFHPHEKAVDGIALFKNKAVIRRGETLFPHKPHETLPKSYCKTAVAGKKCPFFKVAEFHFQRSWSRVVLSSGPMRMIKTAGRIKSTTGMIIFTGASLASFSAMEKRFARWVSP